MAIDHNQLALPKPTRKRKKNHSRRNKTRSDAAMKRDLDDIARAEVFKRDGDRCVRCGHGYPRRMQPMHIMSRRHLCLRWELDNLLTGCGGCHMWWHSEPLLAVEWFKKNWPERYQVIMAAMIVNRVPDVRELWEASKRGINEST